VGKNCGKIVERFCGRSLGEEELWKNCRRIVEIFHNSSPPTPADARPQNLFTIFPQFFHNCSPPRAPAKCFYNSSTILPRLVHLDWLGGRIVAGKIIEELWKYLVNAASGAIRSEVEQDIYVMT
jgi:hypothetical protein